MLTQTGNGTLHKEMRFKDFLPEDVTPRLSILRKYERVEDVVARTNKWIATSGITFINVETLVLPKSLLPSDSIGNSLSVDAGAAILSQWVQIVRVWYSVA